MSRSAIPTKRSADAQEAAWVADEDRFVLQQSKKKAALRIKGGRAQPVDWLAVTLAIIDPDQNALGDEVETEDLDLTDPEGVFEGLNSGQLQELEKGIDGYLALEKSKSNREYWSTMKIICEDRRRQTSNAQASSRGVGSIATDLDKLFGSKNLEELEKLEKQVKTKVASNEPIDTDYWEHLLKSLFTYKAKARLRKVSQSVLNARLDALRKEQIAEARAFALHLESKIPESLGLEPSANDGERSLETESTLDPEPMLRIRQEDKSLDSMTEAEYRERVETHRRMVLRKGYIPASKHTHSTDPREPSAKRMRIDNESAQQSNTSLFDREVARGMGDNEDILTTEEPVETRNKSQWANQYRPRKPRYFNRVQFGYDWNKYNQTHYDHDNPPPKVVQGYKFTVFYPDLVDKMKAPTYRIERDNGRKRGQALAPAGEDDTCVIRFTAGAPYEDVAFRVVDREWDYSAKRERGFKSSFDKVRDISSARQSWADPDCVQGILQLHFQFKKIYYRK